MEGRRRREALTRGLFLLRGVIKKAEEENPGFQRQSPGVRCVCVCVILNMAMSVCVGAPSLSMCSVHLSDCD